MRSIHPHYKNKASGVCRGGKIRLSVPDSTDFPIFMRALRIIPGEVATTATACLRSVPSGKGRLAMGLTCARQHAPGLTEGMVECAAAKSS